MSRLMARALRTLSRLCGHVTRQPGTFTPPGLCIFPSLCPKSFLPSIQPAPPTHTCPTTHHVYSSPPQRFPFPRVFPDARLLVGHPPRTTSLGLLSDQGSRVIISSLRSAQAGISLLNKETWRRGIREGRGPPLLTWWMTLALWSVAAAACDA